MLSCLEQFRAKVQAFVIAHACRSESAIWPYGGPPAQLVLCPIHQVYQHEHGCALCHDP